MSGSSRAGRVLGTLLLTVVLLVVWELAGMRGWVAEIILPRPSSIAAAAWRLLTSDFFYTHLWYTAYEVIAGFAIGTVLGFALGIITAMWPLLREILDPYVVAFQALPKVVLAPVFVTWFGFEIASKIVMAVTVSFFPVYVNTVAGLGAVRRSAIRLMESLTATRWQIFTKMLLPASLPMVFAGVKSALTYALIGAIIGEFVGARYGLGHLIHQYNFQLRIDAVFALILMLGALGLILYLLIEWVDRKVVFWRDS